MAAGVNAILFLLASAGGFLNPARPEGDPVMTVSFGSVIALSAGAAVLGTAVFALLDRFVKHPILTLGIAGAAILLVAPFIPYALAPGGIAGISPCNCGVVAILELMHGFTAIVTLGVLADWKQRHDRRPVFDEHAERPWTRSDLPLSALQTPTEDRLSGRSSVAARVFCCFL